MVRQLLTFAKGAEGNHAPISPARLLAEIEQIARFTFPKNIGVTVRCEELGPNVRGDTTQLHQVLLNLCVNARDAMPDGGALTLEARAVDVDATSCNVEPDAKPGRYVALRVSDTGTGIPPEIIDRIFDPFFTTKTPDRGSGLGLATVLGIVRGHGGFLQVYSQPGRGSTFSAYLPVETGATPAVLGTGTPFEFKGGGEHVLLVDDEATVRELARVVLRRLNLSPMIAADGADGLRQATRDRLRLRAIITDLHMPQMDGVAFVRAVREILPDVPIVITSGRMDEAELLACKALRADLHLPKPFTERQLAEALNQAFAGRGSSQTPTMLPRLTPADSQRRDGRAL